MARKPRVDPPGSWHHVMNRGANRQVIFLDDFDRDTFISVLAAAVLKFGVEIHAYCLMPNHYHLLVRSPDGQLSRTMKFIGQSYTQSFNYRHDRDGALFRGRFHNNLVDSDNYLDTVARYIHRNPVLEWMEDESVLDSFRWSSLPAYEGRKAKPDWLVTSEVAKNFPTSGAYAEFIRDEGRVRTTHEVRQANKLLTNPFRQGVVLGDMSFLNSLVERAGSTAERFRPWILPASRSVEQPKPLPGAT